MTKTINTLVKDINDVIDGKGGWDETITEFFLTELGSVLNARFGSDEHPRGTLRMSNLGSPCPKKLWYAINRPDEGEVFLPNTKLKFLYGDILEALMVSLAIASGHKVEGCQDELYIQDIKGHRDCVIDGITVDIKSASAFSFKKFKDGGLRDNDAFGYISQLSSYVYAGKSTDVQSHHTIGAFLVVDKQSGDICLDVHDLTDDVKGKEDEVSYLKTMVESDKPPARSFEPVPDGGSGNMKLGTNCSYCAFKHLCWPGVRTFLYSGGPRYLTTVARQPQAHVFEVK
jgi:hypothetical protein